MEPSTSYYKNLSLLLKDKAFTMSEANILASILTNNAREKERVKRRKEVGEMVSKHCYGN